MRTILQNRTSSKSNSSGTVDRRRLIADVVRRHAKIAPRQASLATRYRAYSAFKSELRPLCYTGHGFDVAGYDRAIDTYCRRAGL